MITKLKNLRESKIYALVMILVSNIFSSVEASFTTIIENVALSSEILISISSINFDDLRAKLNGG